MSKTKTTYVFYENGIRAEHPNLKLHESWGNCEFETREECAEYAANYMGFIGLNQEYWMMHDSCRCFGCTWEIRKEEREQETKLQLMNPSDMFRWWIRLALKVVGFTWIVKETSSGKMPGIRLLGTNFFYFGYRNILVIYFPWSKNKPKWRYPKLGELRLK